MQKVLSAPCNFNGNMQVVKTFHLGMVAWSACRQATKLQNIQIDCRCKCFKITGEWYLVLSLAVNPDMLHMCIQRVCIK